MMTKRRQPMKHANKRAYQRAVRPDGTNVASEVLWVNRAERVIGSRVVKVARCVGVWTSGTVVARVAVVVGYLPSLRAAVLARCKVHNKVMVHSTVIMAACSINNLALLTSIIIFTKFTFKKIYVNRNLCPNKLELVFLIESIQEGRIVFLLIINLLQLTNNLRLERAMQLVQCSGRPT